MQFRCLLAVGVTASVLLACSGDDAPEAVPLTTTSGVPTTAATTTTAPATTSTTLDFETEVKLAALELLEIRNEVFQAPDVDRVDEYIAGTCVCLERERQIVADLEASGRRWTGPAIVPLGIRIDDQTQSEVAFTLVATQPASSIDGGAEVEPIPTVELAPYFLALVPDSFGGWRINGLEGVTMRTDAAVAIVEEQGLP